MASCLMIWFNNDRLIKTTACHTNKSGFLHGSMWHAHIIAIKTIQICVVYSLQLFLRKHLS